MLETYRTNIKSEETKYDKRGVSVWLKDAVLACTSCSPILVPQAPTWNYQSFHACNLRSSIACQKSNYLLRWALHVPHPYLKYLVVGEMVLLWRLHNRSFSLPVCLSTLPTAILLSCVSFWVWGSHYCLRVGLRVVWQKITHIRMFEVQKGGGGNKISHRV